jgi:hypothetical protein
VKATAGQTHMNQQNLKFYNTLMQKVGDLTKLRSFMGFITFPLFLRALVLRVQETSGLVQIIEQTN